MKVRLPPIDNSTSDVKDTNNINNTNNTNNENKKSESRIDIETKINHNGEVNKARPMPQEGRYNIIATKTVTGEVHIFDYFKHPPKPKDNQVIPEMRLLGHSKEGYGLNWNSINEGYLASGSDDHKVYIY
jgi:histone-binding protein RBBP4